MFLGTFEPSLFEKGRIALPKRIRDNITGSSVILTVGFEKCIFGFDKAVWNDVVRPELNKPLFSDKDARDMRRRMFRNALDIPIDRQGRIVIPEFMLEFALVAEHVYLMGAGDHFEIWEKHEWVRYEKNMI